MSLNKRIELKRFLDIELRTAIQEGIDKCFHFDISPETSWKAFREGLAKIKKKHNELYEEYENSDCEDEIEPSEITKWRAKQK